MSGQLLTGCEVPTRGFIWNSYWIRGPHRAKQICSFLGIRGTRNPLQWMVPWYCYFPSVSSSPLAPFHPSPARQCENQYALGKATSILSPSSYVLGLRAHTARGLQIKGLLVRVFMCPLPGHILLDTFLQLPGYLPSPSSLGRVPLLCFPLMSHPYIVFPAWKPRTGTSALSVSGSTLSALGLH